MAVERDLRFVQLTRMLGLSEPIGTLAEAREAVGANLSQFTAALIDEAAQNDDITDTRAATLYIDGRLAWFGEVLLDARVLGAVLAEVRAGLARWDAPGQGPANADTR